MKPIPTIKEIFERFEDNIKTQLNIPANQELKENLSALGMVISAELKLIYLYMQDVQRNVYPDTADYEKDGGQLNRLGSIYIGRPPHPATNGIYNVSFTGTPGVIIDTTTTFKKVDINENSESVYMLDSNYTVVAGENIITLKSFETGSSNKLKVGDILSSTSPLIGVDRNFIVVTEVEAPLDYELEENYRQAVVNAIQIEPQGGAKGDYILWAQDAAGVRKSYPYVKNNNAGTVQVFIESPLNDSTDGKGTPPQSVLDAVESVITLDPDTNKPVEYRSRKPIQAKLEVLPIEILNIDITIHGLIKTSLEIENQIFENIKNYLYSVRPFIAGGQLNRDKNDILNASRIANEVNNAIENDNYFNDITFKVNGIAYQNFLFNFGKIPYLNSVVYA